MIKRRHLFIALIFYLVLFLFGTFFDEPINAFLFSSRNPLGVAVSALGLFPTYLFFAFAGGYLDRMTLIKHDIPFFRVCAVLFGVAIVGFASFFAQREVVSVNGYNLTGLWWIGWVIFTPIMLTVFIVGWHFGKKNTYEYTDVILFFFFVIMTTTYGGVSILKRIFYRPRFRAIVASDGVLPFVPWYKPFSDYADFITDVITKEEFKSFPSGHANTSGMMMVILTVLPYIFPRLKGKETLLFYTGIVWNVFVIFTRMLVGAHYLSDVAFGAGVVVVGYIIANELVFRKLPPLQGNKQNY